MADLDEIAETLRRQRKDLDMAADQTATRGGETSKVLEKLEELRRRAEETSRRTPIR